MSSSSEQKRQRISTSEKLNWIDAVMADHRLDARAKVVAHCIMQHLNRETGFALVSDAVIRDKTGIPWRGVVRARNRLRAAGWIRWRRTGRANVYAILAEEIAAGAS
jgi:GTP-sensing pleiotropic transcriptional regulator CodY